MILKIKTIAILVYVSFLFSTIQAQAHLTKEKAVSQGMTLALQKAVSEWKLAEAKIAKLGVWGTPVETLTWALQKTITQWRLTKTKVEGDLGQLFAENKGVVVNTKVFFENRDLLYAKIDVTALRGGINSNAELLIFNYACTASESRRTPLECKQSKEDLLYKYNPPAGIGVTSKAWNDGAFIRIKIEIHAVQPGRIPFNPIISNYACIGSASNSETLECQKEAI